MEEEQGDDATQEMVYSVNSFMAVVKPVMITMLLASYVVVNVSTEESRSQQMSGLSAYEVYDTSDESDSDSVRLGKSVINALTIVLVLAGATFAIVLLYKFRCMKCLIGYMMFSSVMLLGIMGGMVLWTALDKWNVVMDEYTYYFILYNFSMVGVIAIFYQQGIPMVVTQGYLVLTSVIMAWQLARFEEWTGWSLLVVLAFYDLCAVLTPCGPLKALVNLMQEYEEPMPGLLYEAELRSETGSNVSPTPRGGRKSYQRDSESGLESASIGPDSAGRVGVETEETHLLPQSSGETAPERPRVRGAGRKQEGEAGNGSPDGSSGDIQQNGGAPPGSVNHPPGPQAAAPAAYVVDPGDEDLVVYQERSIKLGLGDFVFYSVLVSKAALFGFLTCATCFLAITAGLGATLVLLSVYKMALPALPISIFLGVTCYLLTRVLLIPYVENLAAVPIYI
uniref:Presenilin n=1 Tax=Fibrocapsa japonica TaxID=94617 RepID=A0A7S2XWZ8_9STRA